MQSESLRVPSTEDSKNLVIGRLEKLSMGKNQVANIEHNIIKKNGEKLCVYLNNDYIYKNGKLTGSRVVVHDITELKKESKMIRFMPITFLDSAKPSFKNISFKSNQPSWSNPNLGRKLS